MTETRRQLRGQNPAYRTCTLQEPASREGEPVLFCSPPAAAGAAGAAAEGAEEPGTGAEAAVPGAEKMAPGAGAEAPGTEATEEGAAEPEVGAETAVPGVEEETPGAGAGVVAEVDVGIEDGAGATVGAGAEATETGDGAVEVRTDGADVGVVAGATVDAGAGAKVGAGAGAGAAGVGAGAGAAGVGAGAGQLLAAGCAAGLRCDVSQASTTPTATPSADSTKRSRQFTPGGRAWLRCETSRMASSVMVAMRPLSGMPSSMLSTTSSATASIMPSVEKAKRRR